MARRSSVDALPHEIREWIMRLREQGATFDQILAKLRELDTLTVPVPSRSALHRHVQEAERVREMVARQRMIAETMVKELGEVDDSRVARGNVAMLHSILTRVQVAALNAAEEGDDADLKMTPGEIMQLAKAIDHLGKAARDDVARTVTIEKRALEQVRREATRAVEAVARERGMSDETADAIKSKILGIQ